VRRTVSYQHVRLVWYQHPIFSELRERRCERACRRPTLARPRRAVDVQTFDEHRLILEINGVLQASPDPIDGFTAEAHLMTASHKYLQCVNMHTYYCRRQKFCCRRCGTVYRLPQDRSPAVDSLGNIWKHIYSGLEIAAHCGSFIIVHYTNTLTYLLTYMCDFACQSSKLFLSELLTDWKFFRCMLGGVHRNSPTVYLHSIRIDYRLDILPMLSQQCQNTECMLARCQNDSRLDTDAGTWTCENNFDTRYAHG